MNNTSYYLLEVHCAGASYCIVKGKDVAELLGFFFSHIWQLIKKKGIKISTTRPSRIKVLNKRESKLFFLSKKDWSTDYDDYCQWGSVSSLCTSLVRYSIVGRCFCLISLHSDYSKLLKGFKRSYAQFFPAGRSEKVKMSKIATTT